MKPLEKAKEEYEKAKAKAEQMQEKAAAAIKRMKECEAALIESENMEMARIVREMNLTVPELLQLKEQLKTGLPGNIKFGGEETQQNETDNAEETC